jgi:hypothetical protein
MPSLQEEEPGSRCRSVLELFGSFFLANSETAVVFYSFIQSNDSRDSVGRSKETEDFFLFFNLRYLRGG